MAEEKAKTERKLLRIEPGANIQIKELALALTKEKGSRVTEGKAVQIAVQKMLEEKRSLI